MTQRDNILQELNELQSSLVNVSTENVYAVPNGYFDGLIDQVLNRIKALDAKDASEELSYLSPLIRSISKEMPYSVPPNFFNGLAEGVIESAKDKEQTAAEELETISPLLSGLKKEMPYDVPADYFEQLTSAIQTENNKPVAKVVSITKQKWFRYAAAAVVIGFVAIGGFLFLNKKGNIDPVKNSSEWVKSSMKKVNTNAIDSFVELTAPVIASVNASNDTRDKNDIKELIKDISEKDIEDFLNDTQADEPDNDDAMMN